MLTRRQFISFGLKNTAAITVISVVPLPFWQRIYQWFQKKLSGCQCEKGFLCSHCKERIISEALNTPKGQEQLAMAMVEPIRRQLDYQAIGRKLLLVHPLPPPPKFPW